MALGIGPTKPLASIILIHAEKNNIAFVYKVTNTGYLKTRKMWIAYNLSSPVQFWMKSGIVPVNWLSLIRL